MPSDVQVFVRFRDRCVFAGEELRCTIVFKNAADSEDAVSTPVSATRPTARTENGVQSIRTQNARRTTNLTLQNRGRHQASFSLSNASSPKDFADSQPSPRPTHRHGRSVSIISMGSPPLSGSPPTSFSNFSNNGRTYPAVNPGHRRSSTVQLASDVGRKPSASLGRQLSADFRAPPHNGRRSPLSASHSPGAETRETPPEFKFPVVDPVATAAKSTIPNAPATGSKRQVSHRAVSSVAQTDSRRDSADFYSHSNQSGETIVSEQTSVLSERPTITNLITRPLGRSGSLALRKQPQPVKLLMGYAQVGASFTLDSSLVDQSPFEEVKKKGFLGGQGGGGVVGVNKRKSRAGGGLFGGFNFSSIGESLDNILGSDNMSSSKEMKAVANSRAIPLLSTPQSLLFVDLHLEPGEEKSYFFSYKLPKGLPSSYRGKAIKIVYNLTIGVQGAPSKNEMAVRQINVPIRVFSGVDEDGEIYGHDLMQPYVVLRDQASTRSMAANEDNKVQPSPSPSDIKRSTGEFLRYVDTLLDKKRRRQSSVGTIDQRLFGVDVEGTPTMRAIDRAILMSNQLAATNDSSPNRFEIARSGLRIATVILDRPLHRLGETITAVVDLSDGQIQCTSLRSSLETTERVTNALAVRSASAISRITRKVYASSSENVLFVNRAVFCPTIPASAAPTFVTSGVNLDWYIKLEFGTIRTPADEDDEEPRQPLDLLDEFRTDERGTVTVAVESIDCDTFEVSIPITVYGDATHDGKSSDDILGIPI